MQICGSLSSHLFNVYIFRDVYLVLKRLHMLEVGKTFCK